MIKKILIALLTIGVITKILFELDNYHYENQTTKMLEQNSSTTNIKCTVEHKTIEINDCKIHYYVSGHHNKNTIILLHPAFSDHHAFDQQIDHLATDYKVITMDMIGHGLSKQGQSKDQIDATDIHILKIIEVESLGKINLVGVSIGSLLAQYFALNNPHKVKSLTALGGYNINHQDDKIAKEQRNTNLGLIARAIFSMKAFRKKTASITCSSKLGQSLFYQTTNHFNRKSFTVMQGLKNVIKSREEPTPHYPNLIMVGEHDINLAKSKAMEWYKTIIKQSTFHTIKNAGHCANIDNPTSFNNTLKQFIDANN